MLIYLFNIIFTSSKNTLRCHEARATHSGPRPCRLPAPVATLPLRHRHMSCEPPSGVCAAYHGDPSRRCQPESDTLPVPRGILRHVKCRFLPVKKPLWQTRPVSCARATVLTPRRHATCRHVRLSVTLAPPSLHVRTTACPAINLRTKKRQP